MTSIMQETTRRRVAGEVQRQLANIWHDAQQYGDLPSKLSIYLDRLDHDFHWVISQVFVSPLTLPNHTANKTAYPPLVMGFLHSSNLLNGFIHFASQLISHAHSTPLQETPFISQLRPWMLNRVRAEASLLANKSPTHPLPDNLVALMRASYPAHDYADNTLNSEWHGVMRILAREGFNSQADYNTCLPTKLTAISSNKLPQRGIFILVT